MSIVVTCWVHSSKHCADKYLFNPHSTLLGKHDSYVHFIDSEPKTQRSESISQGHIAGKSQSQDLIPSSLHSFKCYAILNTY